MLEAETTREQRRPERSASTFETTLVKVKKHGHVVFPSVQIKGKSGLKVLNSLDDWNH